MFLTVAALFLKRIVNWGTLGFEFLDQRDYWWLTPSYLLYILPFLQNNLLVNMLNNELFFYFPLPVSSSKKEAWRTSVSRQLVEVLHIQNKSTLCCGYRLCRQWHKILEDTGKYHLLVVVYRTISAQILHISSVIVSRAWWLLPAI